MFKFLLIAITALIPIFAFSAKPDTGNPYLIYESNGNDVGHTKFVLFDNQRFVISCDWLESDEVTAHSTKYSGVYRESENVFDLEFESYCKGKKCHKPKKSDLEELFYYSQDSWPIRDTTNVIRMNKNPEKLFLNSTLMRQTFTSAE